MALTTALSMSAASTSVRMAPVFPKRDRTGATFDLRPIPGRRLWRRGNCYTRRDRVQVPEDSSRPAVFKAVLLVATGNSASKTRVDHDSRGPADPCTPAASGRRPRIA